MASEKRTLRHAILIGIDAYSDNDGRPAYLKGCVNDVREMAKILEKVDGGVNINAFTATPNPNDGPSQPACSEPEEKWPTHDNISRCLERVTNDAQDGDHVYIHYSGHGTVLEPVCEYPIQGRDALALVVLAGRTARDQEYFSSHRLALALKSMVDKGVTVTMVLDCCYGGSTLRDGDTPRFWPYSPQVDGRRREVSPYGASSMESIESGRPDPQTRRQASMNWLANPDKYAILTSTDATESSFTVRLMDGSRYGVLTYFLLQTFAVLGGIGGTMKHLYGSLDVKIGEYCNANQKRRQRPVFFGNHGQLFFGISKPRFLGNIPVTVTRSNNPGDRLTLQLHAGQAHGVSEGDRFAIYELGRDSFIISEPAFVSAQATSVRGITSDLQLIGPEEREVGSITTGCLARAITRLHLQRFPVKIDVFEKHLVLWQNAISERESLVAHCHRENPVPGKWAFTILQARNDVYEIRDALNRVLTTIIAAESLARTQDQVLSQIQHLASYKLVRDLAIDSPSRRGSFAGRFDVHLVAGSTELCPGCSGTNDIYDTCHHDGCALTVAAEDEVVLRVHNKGPFLSFIYIYTLGSRWEINNLLQASRVGIKPGEKFEVRVRLSLEEGQDQCEDVFKVFLTAQQANFSMLELPRLGEADSQAVLKLGDQTRDGGASEDWAVLTYRILAQPKTRTAM